MKSNRQKGLAHLLLIVIIVIVIIILVALTIIKSSGHDLPQAPWAEIGLFNDKDDSCGNALGNGDEIISGPGTGVRSDIDMDNPFRSLTVHPTNPDIVYVGTERNGILRSLDGGKTWERLRYGIRHHGRGSYPEVYDMAISHSNPDVIYAAITEGPGPVTGNYPSSYGGVHVSYDAGLTWERKNCGLESGAILSIWIDPEDENHALVGIDAGEITFDGFGIEKGFYPGGLYQTFDGGENWEKAAELEAVDNNSFIQIKSAGQGNMIYTLGTYGRNREDISKNVGLLKSVDNGRTWTEDDSRFRENYAGYFGVSSDGMTLYISNSDWGIFISEDGGASWSKKDLNSYVYSPVVDPANAKRVIYGSENDLYVTEDGFDSSKKIIDRPGQDSKHASDVVFAPSDPSVVYAIMVGYDLYKSADSGKTFIKLINLRDDVLE